VLKPKLVIRSVAILATIAGTSVSLNEANAETVMPYKSDWMEVRAADGSIFKIDKKSISHLTNGTSELIVFAIHDGPYDPRNVRRLWFDCHGRFQDHTTGASATENVRPGSMASELSAIACSRTADVDTVREDHKPPTSRYSARQIDAIRMTELAGWADKHCTEITSSPAALGDALIGAGIELSDFDTSEFKRIRAEADAQFEQEPIETRCRKLWSMFGPDRAYPLVRLRSRYDPPVAR
jgi:hypothetical protein